MRLDLKTKQVVKLQIVDEANKNSFVSTSK